MLVDPSVWIDYADGLNYSDMHRVKGPTMCASARVRFRAEGVDQTIHCEAASDENGAPVRIQPSIREKAHTMSQDDA